MARGVDLQFAANVAPLLAGTQDVEQALGKVSSSLDDVGVQGGKTAEGLERDFRQAFDQVQADAGSAAPKVAKQFDDGVNREGKGRAKETGKEIGGELAQNIGEGIGSGQANIADTLLGTIGGVLPGLGLAAAGVGLGASLVLGMVKGVNKHKAEAIAAAKKFGTDVSDAIADGVISSQDKQNIAQQALGVDTWTDAAAKIAKQARAIGVSANTYTDALAGNVKAQQAVAAAVDATQAKLDAQDKTLSAMGGSTGRGGGGGGHGTVPVLTKAQRELQKSLQDTTGAIAKSNDAFTDAAVQQSQTEQALNGNADAAQDAARRMDEASAAAGRLAAHDPVRVRVELDEQHLRERLEAVVDEVQRRKILLTNLDVPQSTLNGVINKLNAGLRSGRLELP